MSIIGERESAGSSRIQHLWYTRCNVPTASGIAFNLGWLSERYAADGVTIGALQDAPAEIAQCHYDHLLPSLIREGGNVPALVARSSGSRTRLVGLTWIDERQAIVVRPDTKIATPRDLAGARIAVPSWTKTRMTSMARAMALHGFANALALGGLSLGDVDIAELPLGDILPPGRLREAQGLESWPALRLVADGRADAAYVKGAEAAQAAEEAGLTIAINLDLAPDARSRVNNGTPRPLTVHEQLLAERPDWVVAFLAQTLRAAQWAARNPRETREVVARETRATVERLDEVYGSDFHLHLHPDLSAERLGHLDSQKTFLLRHGFLERDFDIGAWVSPDPLEAARHLSAT
jgi:ABC-type nitrate/sulfonate/bicarbonate transport system substrate-binding protein